MGDNKWTGERMGGRGLDEWDRWAFHVDKKGISFVCIFASNVFISSQSFSYYIAVLAAVDRFDSKSISQ